MDAFDGWKCDEAYGSAGKLLVTGLRSAGGCQARELLLSVHGCYGLGHSNHCPKLFGLNSGFGGRSCCGLLIDGLTLVWVIEILKLVFEGCPVIAVFVKAFEGLPIR